MRILLILTVSALLLASCSSSGNKSGKKEAEVPKAEISGEFLTHVHLDVKGMTCEGCENTVISNVKKLEGIQEVTASHTNEEVVVVYDSTRTDLHALSHAIEDAGYSVEGLAAHPHH